MAAATTTGDSEANRGPGPLSVPSKIGVGYLRLIVLLDLLGVVSYSFGQQVHRHSHGAGFGHYFTPFLLTASLVSAALAAFLAIMLRRRKRIAWWCTIVILGFTSLADVYWLTEHAYRHHWFNWFAMGMTIGLLLCLVLGRHDFYAKGNQSNPKTALFVLVGGAAAATVIGVALLTWFGTTADASINARIEYTLLRLLTVDKQDVTDLGIFSPHWLDVLINAMSLALFFLVVYVFFRSPRGRVLHSARGRGAAARTAGQGARRRDSLGYFALRRDKSVIFSPSGKAAIAYRVVGGVSLASGDPIGDPEAWPGAIELWLARPRARLDSRR
jgi:lysyl-tRNA synthetase class 2